MRIRRLITAAAVTLGTLGVLGGSVAMAVAPAAPTAASPYVYMRG